MKVRDALDIKGATKATDNARWCGNRLLATGYWVTDAGRALVNKERGDAA